MSAKEIKALVEIGTSMGYTGDDLKRFVNDERMRMDSEKEKEKEKERESAEKQRAFELEKFRVEVRLKPPLKLNRQK